MTVTNQAGGRPYHFKCFKGSLPQILAWSILEYVYPNYVYQLSTSIAKIFIFGKKTEKISVDTMQKLQYNTTQKLQCILHNVIENADNINEC